MWPLRETPLSSAAHVLRAEPVSHPGGWENKANITGWSLPRPTWTSDSPGGKPTVETGPFAVWLKVCKVSFSWILIHQGDPVRPALQALSPCPEECLKTSLGIKPALGLCYRVEAGNKEGCQLVYIIKSEELLSFYLFISNSFCFKCILMTNA